MQLALSSTTLSRDEVFDFAQQLHPPGSWLTVPGADPATVRRQGAPGQVDLDPQALQAYGALRRTTSSTPSVAAELDPAGRHAEDRHIRIYRRPRTTRPTRSRRFNDLPIKTVNGTSSICVTCQRARRQSAADQRRARRRQPRRAAHHPQDRRASTLDIIAGVKASCCRRSARRCPKDLKIDAVGDQSVFVRRRSTASSRKASSRRLLTGHMILLFLGSWRSTLIVAVSIPLSILASLISCCALSARRSTS